MIESVGLNPLLSGGMDIRSKLDSLNIEHHYHNPKRVDKTTANNASFIFDGYKNFTRTQLKISSG